jgi:hypothetical protein
MGSNTKGGQIGTNSPELDAYIKKGAASVNAWLASYTLLLIGAGVKRVTVEYSGGGDSGQIDGYTCYGEDDSEVENPFGTQVIEKRFESFLYDVLDHRGWDYNNEGCQGSMEWNLEADTFTHHHEVNITQVETNDYDQADDLINSDIDPNNPRS